MRPASSTTAQRWHETVRRLMAAGFHEFSERGLQAATVDDIVSRANVSRGTFYLCFANKDDLFGALAHQALAAMESLADEFPLVTADAAGRAALRAWIEDFQRAYAAHASVIRVLSQADVVGEEAWDSGLKLLFRLAMSSPAAWPSRTPVTLRGRSRRDMRA